jgi:hypothetical protein
MKTKPAKTAAEKPAQVDNDSGERVQVRILESGEYSTGTTIFTFGTGKKVSLPKTSAKTLAEAGRVLILG